MSEVNAGLTEDEKKRYDRQIRIPGWGVEKQIKLKKSKAVIIGTGGLGSPAALYMAAAGVGEITLIDNDTYELSNLNRQILASTKDIGQLKAKVSVKKLRALNPNIKLNYHTSTLTTENVKSVIGDADVVVDALDNWKTRFIINKYCVEKMIPLVHGGVTELGGQVFTVLSKKGPCLNCLFKGVSEVKQGFTVLGATPGIIGSIQALEAIKVLTGIGKPLYDKLLVFDGYNTSFEYVNVKRNPKCEVCGD